MYIKNPEYFITTVREEAFPKRLKNYICHSHI